MKTNPSAVGFRFRPRLLDENMDRHGKKLILCGPHSQPLFALTRAGFLDRIGMDNVCGDMETALARAQELVESQNHRG